MSAPSSGGQARLLEVAGLSVAFDTPAGPVEAVRGVDLSIGRGEIVALVGESGSGKSTIGHCLMGLHRHEARVRLTGSAGFSPREGPSVDLATLPEPAMRRLRGRRMAMIFQEPLSSLNPVFTIGRQIAESMRAHLGIAGGEAERRARELLTELGLPDPAKTLRSYPHEISGGMRQRVMIAIALSCDPDLLIADEPTTALDVTIQAQIVDLLKRIQRRTGMAILFITHDLGLVAEIADRAYVLYAGQIVETAAVAELFGAPLMPYTRALLEARPMLGSSRIPGYVMRPIQGQSPNPRALPKGCAFEPRCPHRIAGCVAERPAIEAAGGGRMARCHRWRDLRTGAEARVGEPA